MTATASTTDAAATQARPPRLMPGKRAEVTAVDADFILTNKPDQEELSFGDVLDVINPLQHLPIVSSIYRAITGDTIRPAMKILGDTIYGGPIGAGVAVASAVAEQIGGADPAARALAAIGIGDGGKPATTAIASAKPAAGPGGLIAEATTAPAATASAATTAATQVAAATPPTTTPPATGRTAASGVPQLSPAAFDALVRSVGAKPADDAKPAEAAAAAPDATAEAAAAIAATPSVVTASAGSTDGRRFFPAHASGGSRSPRPVPMDIHPDDKSSYDAALRMMRANLERYSTAGAGGAGAAVALPAP
ncbi:hypothetical protein [Zavarzinia sp.]|uniref:hypothetical protein n=1 Tax=Zavarzinia sp. TaxID=2027920 RepID=UPI00356ABE1F